MSKAKPIEVTVEGPKTGEIVQIGNVANLAPMTQIVASIQADHRLFESHSKTAAFLALRIGLRLVWVKGNSRHGSLDPFIKEHLSAISRRSLTNYIRIADSFVSELELRDKKTHKLTDASKIAPILDQQLELFTDPNAKLDIHCRQLVEWVNGRGLTQIYRDLSEEEPNRPPVPTGPTTRVKKTAEQVAREEFKSSLSVLKADFADQKWKHLTMKDREKLGDYFSECARVVKEHNKQTNRETVKKK